MENSEIPEKRRKLDEIRDVPGDKTSQPRPMTLGERKRNGPRVLVNRLNLDQDIIERFRRVAKACAKQISSDEAKSESTSVSDVNEAVGSENKEQLMNCSHGGDDKKTRIAEEKRIRKAGGKDTRQDLISIQNGPKDYKTSTLENGKCERHDEEINKRTSTDVQTFKQVLREIIERRTKLVEEAVAANSIHLQNRIQDLERENKELQWNAKKLFGAFQKYVTENEMKRASKTSRGIQVDFDSSLGNEVPTSPVISVPQSTSFLNPVSSAGEVVRLKVASQTSCASSNTTNVASTWTSEDLPKIPSPHQSSQGQQTNGSSAATTAVVFTVTPRPVHVTLTQVGSRSPESETVYSQTRNEQSSRPLTPKRHDQPQALEQRKSSTGVASHVQEPSEASTFLDRIRQNQETLQQQKRPLQEQQNQQFSKSLTPPLPHVQIPTEPIASLLQQLQLQQQIQQRQHYQRMIRPEQKPRERQTLVPSSQVRQEPVLTTAPRQQDPLTLPNRQRQQQSIRSYSNQSFTTQQRTDSSSAPPNPAHTLDQPGQFQPRQKTLSNIAPSLLSFHTRNSGNIFKSDGPPFVDSTSKQVSLSNSNPRSNSVLSNLRVQEHINNLANRCHSNQPSSSLQTKNGGHQSEVLKIQETVSTIGRVVSGVLQREPAPLSDQQHSRNCQQPGAIQTTQNSILVPARKRHTHEDVLPSGFRFSVPSPEYLLQRQRLQKQQQPQLQSQDQPLNLQTSRVSKTQPSQSISPSERLPLSEGQRHELPGKVYRPTSRQTHIIPMQTPPNQTLRNSNSRPRASPQSDFRPVRPPQEHSFQPKLQQKREFQHLRELQPPQPARSIQEQQQSLQGEQHPKANEVRSQQVTAQLPYRPPIQSPGISSSAPTNDKQPCNAQSTNVPQSSTTSHPPDTGPVVVSQANVQKPLPKPSASIAPMGNGIVLSWNMEYDEESIKIDNYELFACQDVIETNGQAIKWKKIGIVKALPLPMACTLTQFSSGSKYFFSVRAVDEKERAGPFSDPCTVALNS